MDDADETPTSAYGVEFGPLKPALREHTYPVTRAELIEQYGGFELEHAGESELLETVLGCAEAATFQDPRQVRDAILAELDESILEGRPTSGTVPDETGDWSPTSVEE